jgi:hypothetical protein
MGWWTPSEEFERGPRNDLAGDQCDALLPVDVRLPAGLVGTGAAAMESDWVVTRPDGSDDLLTDRGFRLVRGFAPVSHVPSPRPPERRRARHDIP